MTEKPTLWNQVEKLVGPLGPRISGEPEIIHEVQDHLSELGAPVSRIQIQLILESVPEIFPEDWLDPGTFDQLSDKQKEVGYKITKVNPVVPIYGAQVQEIIKFAVSYRDQFR